MNVRRLGSVALLLVAAACGDSDPGEPGVRSFNNITGHIDLVSSDASVAVSPNLTGNTIDLVANESDPAFAASPASGIEQADVDAWDLAVTWGDHNVLGYLTAEADPAFVASPAFGIGSGDIANWTTAFGWGDHDAVGYLTAELNDNLNCTNCVSTSELAFDPATQTELDAVTATIPTSVNGLAGGTISSAVTVSGSVTASTLSQSGNAVCDDSGNCTLSDLSGGLLSSHSTASLSASNIPIPDNSPIGVSSVITIPDLGTAQSLTVSVDIDNSDLSTVTVSLTDPLGTPYTLYDQGAAGTNLTATYPVPDSPVSGDLTVWTGANPQGDWTLTVVDNGFLNNSFDGEIVTWSVDFDYVSNNTLVANGDLHVEGYTRLSTITAAPPGTDCDEGTEEGRMQVDTANDLLYICTASGWISK